MSIWEIDMEYRYGRSDINEISIGISIWDVGYRYGILYIYGISIWLSTISIWSSGMSIWDMGK